MGVLVCSQLEVHHTRVLHFPGLHSTVGDPQSMHIGTELMGALTSRGKRAIIYSHRATNLKCKTQWLVGDL